MSTERLNKSTDRVKESRRTMVETEELGVSILQDLHQQRQSLLYANTTVLLYLFHLCFIYVYLLVNAQVICLVEFCLGGISNIYPDH